MPETGLNQNWSRDYDPLTGKYVESDPIGLGGGINPYAYALSSPVDLVDPTGLRVDYNGYDVSNPQVRLNFDILDALIVQSGIDDNCFVLLVTGGDRFRDPADPQTILSAKTGSVVGNSSPTTPHLRDNGARAIDFVIRNKKKCDCKPVTDALVDEVLPWTDFDPRYTRRNYPEGPHTHVTLPTASKYYPGAMQ